MNIIREIEGEPRICIIVSDGELDVVNCGCRAIIGRPCAQIYLGSGGSWAIHPYLGEVLAHTNTPWEECLEMTWNLASITLRFMRCLCLLLSRRNKRLSEGVGNWTVGSSELCRVALVSPYCRGLLIYGGAMDDVWDACNSTRRNVCADENNYVFCINKIICAIIMKRWGWGCRRRKRKLTTKDIFSII